MAQYGNNPSWQPRKGMKTVSKNGWLRPNIIWDVDARAAVQRFTVKPSTDQAIILNRMFVSLKKATVYPVLDALWLTAGANMQALTRNLIQDAYNLAIVGAPTFVPFKYAVGGVGNYFDTGFNPATAIAPKFLQNSASSGFYSIDASKILSPMGNAENTAIPNNGTNFAFLRVNTTGGTAPSGPNVSARGMFISNRSSVNLQTLRKDKAAIITDATASVPSSGNIYLCARNTIGGSDNPVAAAFIGGSMTIAQQDATDDIIKTYLTALGAI